LGPEESLETNSRSLELRWRMSDDRTFCDSDSELILDTLMDVQLMELGVKQMRQAVVKLPALDGSE